MITEDYVSFETAKLLKEKGFNERLLTFYITDEAKKEGCFQLMAFTDDKIDNNHSDHCYLAPTLQMARKWLREVHNLNVEVYRTACGYIGCIVSIPSGTDIKFLEDDGDDKASGTYTKSEYACEAAIKYCLEENLL